MLTNKCPLRSLSDLMDETWGRAWDSGTEDFKCAMFMDTAWFQSEDYVKA